MLADGGSAVDHRRHSHRPHRGGTGVQWHRPDAFSIVWDGQKLQPERVRPLTLSVDAEYFSGNAVPCSAGTRDGAGAVSAQGGTARQVRQATIRNTLEPAISYSRNGFLVSPMRRGTMRLAQVPLFASARIRRCVHARRTAPKPGELFTFPDHAATR